MKKNITDLAFFGGKREFEIPVSTSSLATPDFEKFLNYSKLFFEKKQYTNGGPLVVIFEQRMAQFHDTKHVIAVSSGFWGLVLSIKCLALEGRSEVLMPSLTYRRLADVVAWAGLVPKFCEVDPDTLAISPSHVEQSIDEKTALIIGVHPIIGICDAVQLTSVAEKHNIPLLFDTVESVYEEVNGIKTGSFGAAECFSLHASKLINGFEGGYITTNDSNLALKLRAMRGFGFNGRDQIDYCGINAKLNEMHAAMALANLDDLEALVSKNKESYELYASLLDEHKFLKLEKFKPNERTSYKNILVKIKDELTISRDFLVELLNAEGILARAYYYPPLHLKNIRYPHITRALPVTEKLSAQYILLPCGAKTSIDSIREIISLVNFMCQNQHQIISAREK